MRVRGVREGMWQPPPVDPSFSGSELSTSRQSHLGGSELGSFYSMPSSPSSPKDNESQKKDSGSGSDRGSGSSPDEAKVEHTPTCAIRVATCIYHCRWCFVIFWPCLMVVMAPFSYKLLLKVVPMAKDPPHGTESLVSRELFSEKFPNLVGMKKELVMFRCRSADPTVCVPTGDLMKGYVTSIAAMIDEFEVENPGTVIHKDSYFTFDPSMKDNPMLSHDRQAVLLQWMWRIPGLKKIKAWGLVEKMVEAVDVINKGQDKIDVAATGPTFLNSAMKHTLMKEVPEHEMMTLWAPFGVLAWRLRSVKLLLLALCSMPVSIVVSFGLMYFVSFNTVVLTYSVMMMLMLATALSFDYSLFTLTRYSEERNSGAEVKDAIITVITQSGHVVVVSGLVLSIAYLSMLVLPGAFKSFCLAACSMILTSIGVQLSFVPSCLAICPWLGPPRKELTVEEDTLLEKGGSGSDEGHAPKPQRLSPLERAAPHRKGMYYKIGGPLTRAPWNICIPFLVYIAFSPFMWRVCYFKMGHSFELQLPRHRQEWSLSREIQSNFASSVGCMMPMLIISTSVPKLSTDILAADQHSVLETIFLGAKALFVQEDEGRRLEVSASAPAATTWFGTPQPTTAVPIAAPPAPLAVGWNPLLPTSAPVATVAAAATGPPATVWALPPAPPAGGWSVVPPASASPWAPVAATADGFGFASLPPSAAPAAAAYTAGQAAATAQASQVYGEAAPQARVDAAPPLGSQWAVRSGQVVFITTTTTTTTITFGAIDVRQQTFFDANCEMVNSIIKATRGTSYELRAADFQSASFNGEDPDSADGMVSCFDYRSTAWYRSSFLTQELFYSATLLKVLWEQMVSPERDAMLTLVNPTMDPFSKEAFDLVETMREVLLKHTMASRDPSAALPGLGFTTYSATAVISDIIKVTTHRLPIAFFVCVAVCFVLIAVSFGAWLMPFKLFFTVIIPISWAYGATLFVYEDGYLKWLNFEGLMPTQGRESVAGIDWTVPIFSATIMLGLALDYDVFLFERVYEFREWGFGDRESIQLGLAATGPIISAAGLIFSTTYTSMLLASMPVTNQIGFIFIFSIIVDTFVVRTVLVPAMLSLNPCLNYWPTKMPKVKYTWLDNDESVKDESGLESSG